MDADEVQLTRRVYRDGTGERLEPIMAANTRLMTDAQLQAVSLYLASLR